MANAKNDHHDHNVPVAILDLGAVACLRQDLVKLVSNGRLNRLDDLFKELRENNKEVVLMSNPQLKKTSEIQIVLKHLYAAGFTRVLLSLEEFLILKAKKLADRQLYESLIFNKIETHRTIECLMRFSVWQWKHKFGEYLGVEYMHQDIDYEDIHLSEYDLELWVNEDHSTLQMLVDDIWRT